MKQFKQGYFVLFIILVWFPWKNVLPFFITV